MAKATCITEGCDKPAHTRDLCRKCYETNRASGELPRMCDMPRPPCAVGWCDEPRQTFKTPWCSKHRARAEAHDGDPEGGNAYRTPGRSICEIDSCEYPVSSAGLCETHADHLKKTGDPLKGGILPLEERFWAKVDKRGPTECWPWTGNRNNAGYGVISVRGKQRTAQRVAWELAHGEEMPSPLLACHTCDTPWCVNSEHVYAGDQFRNMRDMVERDRYVHKKDHWTTTHPDRVLRGDTYPHTKISDADVRAVRARITGRRGELKELAAEYGVSSALIALIRDGKHRRAA